MTDWSTRACKGKPAEWFVGPLNGWETLRAKDICSGCPVILACQKLSDEVETKDTLTRHFQSNWRGVWGGEDPVERSERRGLPPSGATRYSKDRRVFPRGEIKHGTPNCYAKNKCRRFECCEANRYKSAFYRTNGALNKGTPPAHGTFRCGKRGCQRPECRAKVNKRERERRKLKTIKAIQDHYANCKLCGDVFHWTTPVVGGRAKRVRCEKCRRK